MPERYYTRQWCSNCKEWVLYHRDIFAKDKETLKCPECDAEFTPYKLADVPEEKIVEQRKRYKEKKKRDFEKLFSGYYLWGRSNMSADMFSETQFPNNNHITEADAGQKAIDERKGKEEEESVSFLECLYFSINIFTRLNGGQLHFISS